MPSMPPVVPYRDIPLSARRILDEIFDPEGAEIWWNSPNEILGNYVLVAYTPGAIPRDHPEAAAALADAIADGVFF